jgi:hypothetical protein
LFTFWRFFILRLVLTGVYFATAVASGHVLVRRAANYVLHLRILFHYRYIFSVLLQPEIVISSITV